MAGKAKPPIANLKKEAKYKVLSLRFGYGGGTVERCGLFDEIIRNSWNTPETVYWCSNTDYVEINILSNKVNIWRSGMSEWSQHYGKLTILKWENAEYEDITSQTIQTTTRLGCDQWEKTISGLENGRYKFTTGNGARMDCEWYIEDISNIKYLLKQNNQFYTIKPNQYKDNQFQALPITMPTKIDYETYGFDDINLLTKNITIGTETFIPIDKFDKSKPLELYKCIEK